MGATSFFVKRTALSVPYVPDGTTIPSPVLALKSAFTVSISLERLFYFFLKYVR